MIDMTYDIKSMAVIGVGVMGSGIAQIAAQSGHTTYLYDAKKVPQNRLKKNWLLHFKS